MLWLRVIDGMCRDDFAWITICNARILGEVRVFLFDKNAYTDRSPFQSPDLRSAVL
jgi:hypothetical protein